MSPTRFLFILTAAALVSFGSTGCTMMASMGGGGGGGGDGGPVTMQLNLPLTGMVAPQQLVAGEPSRYSNTFAIPMMEPVNSVTIDMAATLQNINVAPAVGGNGKSRPRQGGVMTQVTYRIASADQAETVCETGVAYGPFTITGNDAFQPQSVEPATASLDSATVEVINTGQFAVCVEVVSRADATVGIDSLAVEVGMGGGTDDDPPSGNCGSPGDFDGYWIGTYNCTSTCGEDFGGDITLMVDQNGTSASYTDFTDDFSGTICGDEFTFEGLNGSTSESGTLTLTGPNTAMKMSHYDSGDCSGDCADQLTRYQVPESPAPPEH